MTELISVLVYTRESSEPYRARLRDSAEVRYLFCETEGEIADRIAEADVILGSIHFPAGQLARASRLRWFQVTGAGVDAVLDSGALPADVLLTRADVSFGGQITEYVIGHLLARTQRIAEAYRLQQKGRWRSLGVEFVRGWTLGIAGTGSIGSTIAKAARALGMTTLGLSRSGTAPDVFDACYAPSQLDRFLPALDALILCLPLTPQTRGLIGPEELASMKGSAILVNVARGAIVDEAALIDALERGVIRAAILDVFEREPLPPENPLWSMENVTITAHHAGLNIPDEIIDRFLENLARLRAGEPLGGLIDRERGY